MWNLSTQRATKSVLATSVAVVRRYRN